MCRWIDKLRSFDLESWIMTVQPIEPIGFLSYVRDDDEHEEGRLSEISRRLSGEVRIQSGKPFPIFHDKTNIAWGQQWLERIENSLDAVTFLIPVITPAFFESEQCISELLGFLGRERKLGRNDLILQIHYLDCPILRDKQRMPDYPLEDVIAGRLVEKEWRRLRHPLAKKMASRQYEDWRELRFEPLAGPEIRRKLAEMAAQILQALKRKKPKRNVGASVPKTGARKRRNRQENQ
jgi:cobaltochelatase CobT